MYALEAVVDIAYNAGAEPVQSREITRRQAIPRRYLEQVMQGLVRADILKGVRGPRGGYRLARERRRISIGEIARVVRALEDGDGGENDTDISDLGAKVLRPYWDELQDHIMARLDDVNIEELCRRAHASGIESEARTRLDYTI
jgi:Rrf2 family protein